MTKLLGTLNFRQFDIIGLKIRKTGIRDCRKIIKSHITQAALDNKSEKEIFGAEED